MQSAYTEILEENRMLKDGHPGTAESSDQQPTPSPSESKPMDAVEAEMPSTISDVSNNFTTEPAGRKRLLTKKRV